MLDIDDGDDLHAVGLAVVLKVSACAQAYVRGIMPFERKIFSRRHLATEQQRESDPEITEVRKRDDDLFSDS